MSYGGISEYGQGYDEGFMARDEEITNEKKWNVKLKAKVDDLERVNKHLLEQINEISVDNK